MSKLLCYGRTSSDRISSRPLVTAVGMIYSLAVAAPLVAAVALSFSPFDAAKSHWSLEGYKAVFGGGRLQQLAHLADRAFIVTLLACLISVPAAFWIRQRPKAALMVLAALIAPWLVSDMLRAFGWQLLLSPDGP